MKKLLLFIGLMAVSAPLYAAEYGEMATFGIALGAGLAIGIAALGGGIGQGMAHGVCRAVGQPSRNRF